MREYTIVLDPDPQGRGYTVVVPALPGCVTQGRTRAEAIRRAREAIQLHIESLSAEGAPIPPDNPHVEVLRVAV